MKTPLAIWIQRLVAVFVLILTTGLLYAAYLQAAEDPTPLPEKIEQVCNVCDDYQSRKETIKEQFRVLKETHNSLDLQAGKEGILNPAPQQPGEHIDSSAPGRMGHLGTLVYWDKKRKLSYEELALQRLRLDLMEEHFNHVMLEQKYWDRLKKLGEE